MADIVDEKVELRLIDTRQLVKEAKKLKEAARIKRGNDKIQKNLLSANLHRSYKLEKVDYYQKKKQELKLEWVQSLVKKQQVHLLTCKRKSKH